VILVTCLTIASGLLYLSGPGLEYIDRQREDMGLVANPALENAPPSSAFATMAMRAFRGLMVDILLMQAEKLKEARNFFDARQPAEWITTLQPRFATVWELQAWNIALMREVNQNYGPIDFNDPNTHLPSGRRHPDTRVVY
jgi:hypothetical protein